MDHADQRDHSQVPWPYWMLRFIASDNEQAFHDLVWSVGGSPPYGGVSRHEAEAVYDLAEAYRGPGMAPEAAYETLRRRASEWPDRLRTIEVMHSNDEIVSSPGNYSEDPVRRGLTLTDELGHHAANACFQAYQAQLLQQADQLAEARTVTMECLRRFLVEADADPVYAGRTAHLAHNAVALTANAGDVDGARELLRKLAGVLDPAAVERFGQALGPGR